MSRLRVVHATGFRYDGDVALSYNEARMLPASSTRQYVIESSIEVQPEVAAFHYVDYWGTRVTAFEVLERHRELSITATSLVEVLAPPAGEHVAPDGGPAPGVDAELWDALECERSRSVPLTECSAETPVTEPPEDLARFALAQRAAAPGPASAAQAILALVHREVTYASGVTGVRTTAKEAWEERRGVCQDISHIAVGALRAAGVPARYVSGYLHPSTEPVLGEAVEGESHAWVEFWDHGWHAWDPTNDIPVGERHVRIGCGRDYNDVSPLSGIFSGTSGSSLFVRVEIERQG